MKNKTTSTSTLPPKATFPSGITLKPMKKKQKKNMEAIANRIAHEMELILGPFAERLHKKIKVKTKLTKVTSTIDFPSWFDNKAIVKILFESKSDKIVFVDC